MLMGQRASLTMIDARSTRLDKVIDVGTKPPPLLRHLVLMLKGKKALPPHPGLGRCGGPAGMAY